MIEAVRVSTPRSVDEAWSRIVDHFHPGEEFTLREAVKVGFPGVSRNNISFYARKLRKEFQRIAAFTAENLDGEHVRCVAHPGSTPSLERWVLPVSETQADAVEQEAVMTRDNLTDRTGYAAGIEAAAIELDNLTAAVTALARHNIPPDVQELLLAGNPSRGIAPGALKAALSATVPAPAIEDEDVERVKLALSPLVNEDMAEEMRDAWLDDLARAALASMPRLPKEM